LEKLDVCNWAVFFFSVDFFQSSLYDKKSCIAGKVYLRGRKDVLMNGITGIIIGFTAGCVIASGLWAVLWVFFKSERHADKSRIEIKKEIASEYAEIENHIVLKNLKKISDSDFRSAVSPRLEKITKYLSVNMELFDVYYVKYIESLIIRYRQALIPSEKSDQPEMHAAAGPPREKEADILFPTTKQEPIKAPADLELTPENLDQTWQMDFSKIRSERALDKKVGIIVEKGINEEPPAVSTPPPEEKLPVQPSPEEATIAIEPSLQEKAEETVFERLSPDLREKDTKIIKTENIPQEKQSEIEKIIIAELNREPDEKTKQGRMGESGKKKKVKEDVPEFVQAEIGNSTGKTN
jgi:hypothetical protein